MNRFRQLLTIIRREARDHLLSRPFVVLAGVVLLLTPLAMYAALAELQRQHADFIQFEKQRAFISQAGARLLTGSQPEPALRIARPPSAGRLLSWGIAERIPISWDPGPAGVRTTFPSGESNRSAVDLEFLLRILLGILAIIMGAETVASERSAGTLKTILSQPLTAATVAAGKLLGGGVVLAVASGAMTVIGLAATALGSSSVASVDTVLTAIAVWVAGLAYLWTVFAIGMIAGVISHSSSEAVIVALTLWIFIGIVSLPAIELVARAAAPVAPRNLFEEERDAEFATHLTAVQEQIGSKLRDSIGQTTDLRTIRLADALSIVEPPWDSALRSLRDQIDARELQSRQTVERQRRLISVLSVLTPGVLFFQAASNLSGTGTSAAVRWAASVDAYQNRLERLVFDSRPRIHLRVPGPRGTTIEYFDRRPLPNVKDLPTFEPPNMSLQARLGDAVVPLVLLLIYLLAAWTAAIVIFRSQAVT